MIRGIVTYPDPVLRRVSEPVGEAGVRPRALLDDLMDTLHAADGIGLAAIQVGVPLRVAVVDLRRIDGGEPLLMIDPKVEWASHETSKSSEGCLSVPGPRELVVRSTAIVISYGDADGRPERKSLSGLAARCVLHEIDHLDGKLFLDRMSRLRRIRVTREYVRAPERCPVPPRGRNRTGTRNGT